MADREPFIDLDDDDSWLERQLDRIEDEPQDLDEHRADRDDPSSRAHLND